MEPRKVDSKMLSDMICLAASRHQNQYDKGGNPYILHPLKVMYYLKTNDIELQCIAVGHDLIEDTNTTYTELKEMGFTPCIIEGIRALTKLPGQTAEEYLDQVCSNSAAMCVKLADLRHNSDIRRLKGVTPKDIERIAKYHNMWLTINDRLTALEKVSGRIL